MQAYLLLILAPVIIGIWTWRQRPGSQWKLTGAAFGAIAYPFFRGLAVGVIGLGAPVATFIAPVTTFLAVVHRWPGFTIVTMVYGHRPRGDLQNLWVYALNAVIWGVAYWALGWFLDRRSGRRSAARGRAGR